MSLADMLTVAFGTIVPAIATIMVWRGTSPVAAAERPVEADAEVEGGLSAIGTWTRSREEERGDQPRSVPANQARTEVSVEELYEQLAEALIRRTPGLARTMEDLRAEGAFSHIEHQIKGLPTLPGLPKLIDLSPADVRKGRVMKLPLDVVADDEQLHPMSIYLLSVMEESDESLAGSQQEKLF